MSSRKIFTADRIFTGENWLTRHAIVVEEGRVASLIPLSSLAGNEPVQQFDQCFIAPAFIDLQIYGAYGKLLAVYPVPDSLHRLRQYCEKGGASLFLPTVATNTKEVFYQCIDAVRAYWKEGGEGVPGLHLEGPWLNPLKRGAHIEGLIHKPAAEEIRELLDYGRGVIRMITLAPECCGEEIISMLREEGIVLSAGHCNANYTEAKKGFAAGITAVTHLYNAMSPLQHRQPGLVGAAMDDEKVMASIIPDGHHVDYAAIRIAKAVMKERLFVITDAVTDTTQGYYPHQLAGDKYEAAGILSGSALDMSAALRNLVNFAGIDLGEALRMCSLYPARLMGWQEQGRIAPGCSARMLLMTEKLEALQLL